MLSLRTVSNIARTPKFLHVSAGYTVIYSEFIMAIISIRCLSVIVTSRARRSLTVLIDPRDPSSYHGQFVGSGRSYGVLDVRDCCRPLVA